MIYRARESPTLPPCPLHAMKMGTSSEEDERERIRARIGRKRWEGDNLELERKNPSSEEAGVTVDFEQFRNYHVGKGYQAKHVVRQRTLEDQTSTKKPSPSRKRSSSQKSRSSGKKAEKETSQLRVKRYLRSEAFRKFRKEIETIMTT